MLLYLDLNCFNRPFDDQRQARIAEETAAIFRILERITDGVDGLTWSDILTFENNQHPLVDRRSEIARWEQLATHHVAIDNEVRGLAKVLSVNGLKPLDAAHVACAEVGGSHLLLSCDDRLVHRAQRVEMELVVENPLDYLRRIDHG